MASTFTTNLHLELQGTGEHSGTWGSNLNTNSLNIIDLSLGGVQTLSLASTDVTVTTTQSQNNAFILTGLLTANVAVVWPAIGRSAFIVNNTTGAFTVTIKCGTPGATVVAPTGSRRFYILNVNDVYSPTTADVGDYKDVAYATAPSGWLLCYGQAISRSTYAALFLAIGTTYGVGDGLTTFNVPDARGRVAAGRDDMGGAAASRLTATTMTPNGNTLGAVGGAQTHTLSYLEMPTNAIIYLGAFADQGLTGSTGRGSGQAHLNTQPTMIANRLIYAGV